MANLGIRPETRLRSSAFFDRIRVAGRRSPKANREHRLPISLHRRRPGTAIASSGTEIATIFARALQDLIAFLSGFEFNAHGVEKLAVENSESLDHHMSGEILCQPMNFLGDRAQSARSVINRIHRCDHGEEHLRCADIARGFVAPNVLFAGLEREPVAWPAGGIVRETPTSRPGMWRL